MQPILQVALDFINTKRALTIAQETITAGADWIEAGTPLIKAEGMHIIRTLKKQFPTTTLVADMKTMDTGTLETEIAAKAGANIICLLGVADTSTITEAVQAAHKYGAKIMVDLIGCTTPEQRAKDLEHTGIDYLCLHTGIDQQMHAQNPLKHIQTIAKKTTIPIAVAGGLNTETIPDVIKAGAHIIIVGGAITKAPNITQATKQIKKTIQTQQKISSQLYKKYDTTHLKDAFQLVSTPNISDALHRKGMMHSIKPIKHGYHMIGQAYTVQTIDGDWAKPVEAIDHAQPGNILVINAQQGTTAVWGELATWSAQQKKLAGIVIDGAVRDLDDLLKLTIPIFCRNIAVAAGEPKGFGELDIEIQCGHQTVHPKDWIIGDDSGVVVVPQRNAQEIANRAIDIKEHENRLREEIKKGNTLASIIDLKKWEKII